jgi:hypothetical protein
LVTIKGRGPTWSASITAEGRAYLEHAAKPDAPLPRQANVSVTQQLVDDVVAAGGTLRVPRRKFHKRGEVDYTRRAELAQNYGKVPPGMALVTAIASDDELEIKLVDAFGGHGSELVPVPLPEKVSRYHRVVREFRDRADRHEVSRAAMPRALRILQAVIVEAERRCYDVSLVPDGEADAYGRRSDWIGSKHGHLVISVNGDAESIRVSEDGLSSRTYWVKKNGKWNGSRYVPPPLAEYEADATGRLTLALVSGWQRRGRAASWSDRQSWTLDEKLPDLLHEIEVRAAEAEERRQDAARKADEQRRQWETAMETARQKFAESLRTEALSTQVGQWRNANEIRAYCDTAERRYSDETTQTWIAWARAYADDLDPLRMPPKAPAPPDDVRPEDLRPFLQGWSAYGPDRHGW